MSSDGDTTSPPLGKRPLTVEQMFSDRGFLLHLNSRIHQGGANISSPIQRLVSAQMEMQALFVNARTLRRDTVQPDDPRRNLDDECGYPPQGSESLDQYENLFKRSSIANRVISFWPSETWQVEPEVFEDDDPAVTTPFEQAVADLLNGLNVEDDYFEDEKGNTLWQYLFKLDKLSGIGHYGILLLGLDDGLPLSVPVAGITEYGSMPAVKDNKPSGKPTEFPDGDVSRQYIQVSNKDILSANAVLPQQFPEYKLTINKVPTGKTKTVTDIDPEGNPVEKKKPETAPAKRKLIYLRAYSELHAQITEVETNRRSPRYGKPVKYLVTMHPEAEDGEVAGGPSGLLLTEQYVHWTRVIHVADNLLDNETYGIPRLEPALNDVLDINKVKAAAGEGYYKGAFPGHSFETHPSMGADVNVDIDALRNMYEEYQNGLQRGIFTAGLTVKTLEPQVVDPTNHLNRFLDSVCVYLEAPKRIFMGSERGELASSQDAMQHRGKIKQRQHRYVTPKMIVPLFNRFIWIGCLPPPKTSFKIYWPKVETLDMQSEATFAKTMAEAMAAYLNSGCGEICPPQYFFTKFLGFRDEEVQIWLKEGEKIKQERMEEEATIRKEEQANTLEQTKVAASLKPKPNNGKPQTTGINPKPKSKE